MMDDNEERLTTLIDCLLDEDSEARYEAAHLIGRMGRSALARVFELSSDVRPKMRAMACYILGQIGKAHASGTYITHRYPDGIPTLRRRLESDPDEDVRDSAAAALGHHGAHYTLPTLCRAASDPSAQIRFTVAWALGGAIAGEWEDEEGRRHRPEVIRTLLRLMDGEDDDVRDWATFSMHQGKHDTPEVRARFWEALEDPFENVRAEAALGLALLGDRDLVPHLEPILREDGYCQPLHYEAAMELGDPCLLPAALEGAELWRTFLEEGEELPWQVTRAIEALRQAADRPSGTGDGDRSSTDDGIRSDASRSA